MYIYTVKKQKLKNSSRGVRNSTKRPKIRRLRRTGYRKNYQRTAKDIFKILQKKFFSKIIIFYFYKDFLHGHN